MANLRLSSIEVKNSSLIRATFSNKLNKDLTIENIFLESQLESAINPSVLKIKVFSDYIDITTTPLNDLTSYSITFKSTTEVSFTSLNGNDLLLEDGVGNYKIFVSPLSDSNVIKDYFLKYLSGNVYNTESGTVINNYITAISQVLSRALNDIRQARNENYLSFVVEDELKTRGIGPSDRLNEECCYKILRVGKNPSGYPSVYSINYSSIPSDQVSLLQTLSSEILEPGSSDSLNIFNKNTFNLNLSKKLAIKLESVKFTYSDGRKPYEYDIAKYGYKILDARYDSLYGFKFNSLESNQIKLNDKILEDADFSINSIFRIEVNYYYKDAGRSIDYDSLKVFSIKKSIRESLSPLKNIFSLRGFPVVSSSGTGIESNGVSFIDQNVLRSVDAFHPAFIEEIKFRLDALPSSSGQYAINYNNGTVYVYGEDGYARGTGAYPPLASYNYKLTYTDNIDYVIDRDNGDLAILSTGSIDGSFAIQFNYEKVLAEGIDFISDVHNESIDERINNNLKSFNKLIVNKYPISDVFRVYNESTGEIYNPVRWNGSEIEFSYIKPPRLKEVKGEKSSFKEIVNETLFINDFYNTPAPQIKIFEILLSSPPIASATEDSIGSSVNTSLSFNDNSLFSQEIYFNILDSVDDNLSRLDTIGKYCVDYRNGIVYVAADEQQSSDIGYSTYKTCSIKTNLPHILSVENVYWKLFSNSQINEKNFDYLDFEDKYVNFSKSEFNYSSEQCFNDNLSIPYVIYNNQIGFFDQSSFIDGLSNNIKFLRGVYSLDDLLNNKNPINFNSSSEFTNNYLTVNSLNKSEYSYVEYDGYDYSCSINFSSYFLSNNINLQISITRLSDGYELWDNSGSIVVGDSLKFILSGVNSPSIGDAVNISLSFTINDLTSVVIDYSRGDLLVDYTSLIDEILVSYEYGDNSINFQSSNALSPGEDYYVTYKCGALRNALIRNFGTSVDFSFLQTPDVSLNREVYRDSLMAVLSSFALGPTKNAVYNIAKAISRVPPKIKESIFEGWSLGSSLLYPRFFESSENLQLDLLKHGQGIIVDEDGKFLSTPVAGGLKFEEGSIQTWVKPEWDGLDNNSFIYITPLKNNVLMSSLDVFIGAAEEHPTYQFNYQKNKYEIKLDPSSIIPGIPNKNKDGLFIYYSKDVNGFNKWNLEVIDGYNDGYYDLLGKDYKINVNTDGKFYDIKILDSSDPYKQLTTTNNSISFNIIGSSFPKNGLTFFADYPRYLYDYVGDGKGRFSIYKDVSGYLNFDVSDDLGLIYSISADVSGWRKGELHHIGASWKINSKTNRDELHLFIDGFEVPNIIKYGERSSPYHNQKFRTVAVENIIGKSDKNIVSSNDLNIISGSYQVISSLNFDDYGIMSGDTIFIEENGFDINGYIISNVNGNILTLSLAMPLSLQDGKFTVNKKSFTIKTEAALFPNTALYSVNKNFDGYDLFTTLNSPYVYSPIGGFEIKDVKTGVFFVIQDNSFDEYYKVEEIVSNTVVKLDKDMPIDGYGFSFIVYQDFDNELPGQRAIDPSYSLVDGYKNITTITLLDNIEKDDILILKTLGINHKKISKKYYQWGNSSNIFKTLLPAPTAIDSVNISKIILDAINVGPATAIYSAPNFIGNFSTYQPSNSVSGRTLNVRISGDNVDFSLPVSVYIDGYEIDLMSAIPVPANETILFSDIGSISTSTLFSSINYIEITCQPINSLKNSLTLYVEELYPIDKLENNVLFTSFTGLLSNPIIKFSYQAYVGNKLASDGYNDGYQVTDESAFYSDRLIGQILAIKSPLDVAGYYLISSISSDRKTLYLSESIGSLPLYPFSSGVYEILNVNDYGTGLQNGYFVFENSALPKQPFNLTEGIYKIDYYSYLNIPFKINNSDLIIGNNVELNSPFCGTIGNIQSFSQTLSDVRVGEKAYSSQKNITSDFNSAKFPQVDNTTLLSSDFSDSGLLNTADVYKAKERRIIQSGNVVNSNFNNSIVIKNNSIYLDNFGLINSESGTIEFWISPLFDAKNDFSDRIYFNASSVIKEEVVSSNNITLKLAGKALRIIKIINKNNPDLIYSAGASLASDNQTITLAGKLPSQNVSIIIYYIPFGSQGDSISIFKDKSGYLNFQIIASELEFLIRAPIFWKKGTWHRVKAKYNINNNKSNDEMHLMIDGYEYSNMLFGSGLIYGQDVVFGSTYAGPNKVRTSIKFKDKLNNVIIGGNELGTNAAFAMFDNFKISSVMSPDYKPFGEPIDPNYFENIDAVYPVSEDLYTTLLLNFDSLLEKTEDLAVLRNKKTGSFDFSVNVYDSFDIINDDDRIKAIITNLIKAFKPAVTKSYINFKKN